MRAGTLDRRIQLQQQGAGSSFDPESGDWATTRTVYAERMSPEGGERFIGTQRIAEGRVVYRIYYNADITPLWRLRDRAEVWKIEAVLPGNGRNQETILDCSRVNPTDASG